ncbi:MAG: hypothetical protein E7F77_04535 [Serratia marcescens]|uniref:hypothetical protein n=1 Tax=Serratia marcescens TaxID=615 RepID=UPI00290E3EF7|nr:hypothetical protein [Serratia marcescens]MDU3648312.1 hypothetical protein [Serratia marcescens]
MEIVVIALLIAFLVLVAQLGQIISLQKKSISETKTVAAFLDEINRNLGRHTESIFDVTDQLKNSVESIELKVGDIKYVMDVIEKYSLPDKEQRKVLDQVKIDNEIYR